MYTYTHIYIYIMLYSYSIVFKRMILNDCPYVFDPK